MSFQIFKISQFFKAHSTGILKSCMKNCNYLIAYKLRKGQQAIWFHKKLWGEARLKKMFMQLQSKLINQIRGKKFAFVLNGVALTFDWNKNRIKESYMKEHYMDLEYVEYLKVLTLTCDVCQKRLVVDNPVPNISYCECPGSKPVYNKKFGTCPWLPFIERKDLLIWRREREDRPGLYQYKMFGRYDEIRADKFLQVQLDTEYRKEWDPTAVEVRIVEKDPLSNSDILYWEMQWPRMFANRDYVFNRRYIIDISEQVIVITNQLTEHPKVPEMPKKFRVKEYECNIVIKPTGKSFDKPGVTFCVTYFDNPGLTIPKPVQAWAATTTMTDFLNRLREASRHYPDTKMDSVLDKIDKKTDNYYSSPYAFTISDFFQTLSYPKTYKFPSSRE